MTRVRAALLALAASALAAAFHLLREPTLAGAARAAGVILAATSVALLTVEILPALHAGAAGALGALLLSAIAPMVSAREALAAGLALAALATRVPNPALADAIAIPLGIAALVLEISLGSVALATRLAASDTTLVGRAGAIGAAVVVPPFAIAAKLYLVAFVGIGALVGYLGPRPARAPSDAMRRLAIATVALLPGLGIVLGLMLPHRLLPHAWEGTLERALLGALAGAALALALVGLLLVAATTSPGRRRILGLAAAPWAALPLGVPAAVLLLSLAAITTTAGATFLVARLRPQTRGEAFT